MAKRAATRGSEAPSRAATGIELAPTADDESIAGLAQRIADTVRELRRVRGYSLDELAARSGVSRASLSQVESAKTNPTLAVLWRMAAGLGVSFSALLGDEPFARVRVLRRQDQQVLRSASGGMESRPLAPPGSSRLVEVYELMLMPHSKNDSEPHPSGTTELVVVLSGMLRLRVGDTSFDLGAGDSAFFAADEPHGYDNPARATARVHNVILYVR